MAGEIDGLLAGGRAALRTGDAQSARRAFEEALAIERCGDAIEGLARVAYLEQDYTRAIEGWEQAYASHREGGDHVGAVRVARTLAGIYGTIVGDAAVMQGWMARAQRLMADAADSPECGWVALNRGMFEADRDRKEEYFHEALDVARRHGDADLEFVTLAYLGASMVHSDRIDEGMALLDESLAAVAGSDVDDFSVLEEIFCQLFSACEHAYDVVRADQWIRVGEAIAERRKLPAVSAFCRTHYGGVLTAAGRWMEADATLSAAARLWEVGRRSQLRNGAIIRLADLRVLQGRFEEAEQLLLGLGSYIEASRPIAAIHLARGQTSLAIDVLAGALDQIEAISTSAAPLLVLLVEAHLAAGHMSEADAAADQLARCASDHPSEYLAGAASLARGRLLVATGGGEPQAYLRAAVAGFSRAQAPMETAQAQLELASSLAREHPDVARAEARAALGAFEQLHAARGADAAAALLRSLGVRVAPSAGRGTGRLSKREAEVLDLIGHGLSNVEISDRLFISRKTVEHHVGNILAKLGLRSRTEATAYLLRSKEPGAE